MFRSPKIGMEMFGDENEGLLDQMLEDAVEAVASQEVVNNGEDGGPQVEDAYQEAEQLMHGGKRKRDRSDQRVDYTGGGLSHLSYGLEASQQQRQMAGTSVQITSELLDKEHDGQVVSDTKRQRVVNSEQEIGHSWQEGPHKQVDNHASAGQEHLVPGPEAAFPWASFAEVSRTATVNAAGVLPEFEGSVPGLILRAVETSHKSSAGVQSSAFVFGSNHQTDTLTQRSQETLQATTGLGTATAEHSKGSHEGEDGSEKMSAPPPTSLDLNVEATTFSESKSVPPASGFTESVSQSAAPYVAVTSGPRVDNPGIASNPSASSGPALQSMEQASNMLEDHAPPFQSVSAGQSDGALERRQDVLLTPPLPQPPPSYPMGDPGIIALQLAQIEAHIFAYGRIIRGENVEPELHALAMATIPKATSGPDYEEWLRLETTWKMVLETKEAAALLEASVAPEESPAPEPPTQPVAPSQAAPPARQPPVAHVSAQVEKQAPVERPSEGGAIQKQGGQGSGRVKAAARSRGAAKKVSQTFTPPVATASRPDVQFWSPPPRPSTGQTGLTNAGPLQPLSAAKGTSLNAPLGGNTSTTRPLTAAAAYGKPIQPQVQPVPGVQTQFQQHREGPAVADGVRTKRSGRPRGRPKKLQPEEQATPGNRNSFRSPSAPAQNPSTTPTPPLATAQPPPPPPPQSAPAFVAPGPTGAVMGPLMLGHMFLGTPGSTGIQSATSNFLAMAAANPSDARSAAQAAVSAAAESVAASSQEAAAVGAAAHEALAQKGQKGKKGRGKQGTAKAPDWEGVANKAATDAQAGATAVAALAAKAQEEIAKIGQQLWQRQMAAHGEAGAAAAEALAACHVVRACVAAAEAAAAVAMQAKDKVLAKTKEKGPLQSETTPGSGNDAARRSPAGQETAAAKFVLALSADGGTGTSGKEQGSAQLRTGESTGQPSAEPKKVGAVSLKAAARSGGRLGLARPQASPSQMTPPAGRQTTQGTQSAPLAAQPQGQLSQVQFTQPPEQLQHISPPWMQQQQQQQQAGFHGQFPPVMQGPPLQSSIPGISFPLAGSTQPWSFMSPPHNVFWAPPTGAPPGLLTPAAPTSTRDVPAPAVQSTEPVAPPRTNTKQGSKRQLKGASAADAAAPAKASDVREEEPRGTARKKSKRGEPDKATEIAPVIGVKHKFAVGGRVECSSNEVGFRGGWFTATVVQITKGRALVRYDEILEDNGKAQLEDWIPVRPVSQAEGMEGEELQKWMRPAPKKEDEEGRKKRRAASGARSWKIGDHVDAWVNDGWWEGEITDVDEEEGKATVFFPGEGDTAALKLWELRPTLVLMGDHWVPWGTHFAAPIISAEDVPAKEVASSVKQQKVDDPRSTSSAKLTGSKLKAAARRPQKPATPTMAAGVAGSNSLSSLKAEMRSGKKQVEAVGKSLAGQAEGIATRNRRQAGSGGQDRAVEGKEDTAKVSSGRAKRLAAMRARLGRRAGQEDVEDEDEDDSEDGLEEANGEEGDGEEGDEDEADEDEDKDEEEEESEEGEEEEEEQEEETKKEEIKVAPRKRGRPPKKDVAGNAKKPVSEKKGAKPSAAAEGKAQRAAKRGSAGGAKGKGKGGQEEKKAKTTADRKKLSNAEKEWKRLGISLPPPGP